MRTDGRTGRHAEGNNRFSNLANAPKNPSYGVVEYSNAAHSCHRFGGTHCLNFQSLWTKRFLKKMSVPFDNITLRRVPDDITLNSVSNECSLTFDAPLGVSFLENSET